MDKNTPQLYYTPMSAPCRSVLMVAAALRLKLNLKPINMMEQEHLRPTFLRISPHHIVPTLVDNEFSMFESRAICIYLVEKYGKNDALYPKNPKTRATINQLIYFDMGTLFKRFYDYFMPMFHGNQPEESKLEALKEAMGFLDNFLVDKKFAVNYRLTIADLILLSSVSTIETVGFDFSPYEHVRNWYSNMQAVAPGYEMNKEGLALIKGMMSKMAEASAAPEVTVAKAADEPPTKAEKLVQFEKIKFAISDDGKVVLSPDILVEPKTLPIITPASTQGIAAIPEVEVQAVATPLIEIVPTPEVSVTTADNVEVIAKPLIEIIPTPAEVGITATPLIEIIPTPAEVGITATPLIEVVPTPAEVGITATPLIEIVPTPEATIAASPLVEIVPTPEIITQEISVTASPEITINSTSELINSNGINEEIKTTTVTSSSEIIQANSTSEVTTQEVVTVVKEVITTSEFTKVVQSESKSEIVNGTATVEIVQNGENVRL